MIKFRDYQEECINQLLELNTGDKVVVKSPTGSGKTIILAGLVSKLSDSSRVLIVVPSTELREQTIEKLKTVCGDDIDVGSVQGTINNISNRIVVATRQSLTHSKSTRMDRLLSYGEFSYILYDEAHQATFQIQKIMDSMSRNSIHIGFTATPYNQDMTQVFDKVVFERHILDMIDKNYLVEPRCKLIQSTTSLDDVKTVAGEFNQGQLESAVNNQDRNQLIVDSYIKYGKDRKHCLVFATGIDHCDSITKCFNSNGIEAYSLDSSDDKETRSRLLEEFKSGKFKVLVNVGILTTGFDMESLDTLILCRPTKSRILYEQIIGRALRTFPYKEDALIIDIVDVATKHNLMDLSSVFNIDMEDGETPNEAKERIRQLEESERLRLENERIRREELKRRELEIYAREILLFNRNMSNILRVSQLDWFKHSDNVYCIMGDLNNAMSIKGLSATEFIVYSHTNAGGKWNANEVYQTNNLNDCINYCDKEIMNYGSSFCKRSSRWKQDAATENQMKYIDIKKTWWVKTKWDAIKCMFNRKIYYMMK